jgi:hypothetical protein
MSASSALSGSGDVTVTGLFTWTGGTISGIRAFTTGGMSFPLGNNHRFLSGRTLTSLGTAAWSEPSGFVLQLSNGAVFNNPAGATFDSQTNLTIQNGGGAAPSFTNAGTFTKSGGTGTTTINVPFTNTAPAATCATPGNCLVSVTSGTLTLGAGSTSTGAYQAAVGTTLNLSGGNHTISGSISGAGTIGFPGGGTTITGPYNVTGATTISGGTVNFLAGATVTNWRADAGARVTIPRRRAAPIDRREWNRDVRLYCERDVQRRLCVHHRPRSRRPDASPGLTVYSGHYPTPGDRRSDRPCALRCEQWLG